MKEKQEKEHENADNMAELENEVIGEEQADSKEEVENKEESENGLDELAEMKDKYLRLYSEFDNFRRRTAKEKLDVIQTANADLLVELLPTIDDFERAMKASEDDSKNEGLLLIYNKFKKTLENVGLREIEASEGTEFDVELHEAISQVPAPNKKLKGKILDVVERGYYLKEKVIRFAKVVVGS